MEEFKQLQENLQAISSIQTQLKSIGLDYFSLDAVTQNMLRLAYATGYFDSCKSINAYLERLNNDKQPE